jgi:flagellar M-ring protein FliF
MEETFNYEINRVVENTVREPGAVRRLSIAVLVDGIYQPGADGTPVYAPRSDDELTKLQSLVSSAVGFDADRGDTIEVINLPFAPIAEGEAAMAAETLWGLDRSDLIRMIELAVIGIVAGLVLLLVVRPLLRRALHGTPEVASDISVANLLTHQSAAALAGGAMGQLTGPGPDTEEMINIVQVEGKVRSSAVRKVAEIVDGGPEAAAGVLRQWLYQEP